MTALAAGAVEAAVLDVVASRTLYEPEYLGPDSHLEGELGVDPVILESILAALQQRFGLTAALPAVTTIRELVHAVETAIPPAVADAAAGAAPDPGGSADRLTEAVLAAAIRHTRYRRDQLALDAALERELGIDSVVLGSIVADVAQELELPATGASTAETLRDLIDRLRPGMPPQPVRLPRASGPADPSSAYPARTAEQAVAVAVADPVGLPAAGPWDDRSMKDFMEQPDADLFAKTRSFTAFRRSREEAQLYWYGMPLQSRCANRAVIRDELTGRTREFLMFASNNYLGLANHPKVIEAIRDATEVYGATNTGCRLIGGTNRLHKELEQRLAAFKQRPACIVFPGGYSANVGTISALARGGDTVIADKYNHMSIVDGTRLSGAARRIYQHNDMADLEGVLERSSGGPGGLLVVTDGVFSMHGDVCPLPEIVRLARRYGARVLVDDAHATGVLGSRGSGTAEHFGLKGEVDLELGTMSKTLAGMGGFVAGDEDVVEYLRYYANSYVFAATIPAGVAAGLLASLDLLESEPDRVARLWSNIRRLRGRLLDAGFDLENSDSAVLPIVIGDERTTLELGRAVRERGLFCQTVVFPGVALGQARLRISVTSEHTAADLDLAAEIILAAARETGVRTTAPGRPS